MSNYVLIFLAVVLFAAQFAFTRLYEGAVKQSTAAALVLLVVTGVLLLILAFISVYLFAVLAQFENETKEIIKWSAILAVRHLPVTLICLLIAAIPVLCMIFIPVLFLEAVLPITLLIGFSGIAYIHAFFFVRVFAYYMPKEEESEEE